MKRIYQAIYRTFLLFTSAKLIFATSCGKKHWRRNTVTRYNYYDLAADILAENAELTYKYLEQDDYEFLDALILAQASPEEAYKRFDELSVKHIDKLRKVPSSLVC